MVHMFSQPDVSVECGLIHVAAALGGGKVSAITLVRVRIGL